MVIADEEFQMESDGCLPIQDTNKFIDFFSKDLVTFRLEYKVSIALY